MVPPVILDSTPGKCHNLLAAAVPQVSGSLTFKCVYSWFRKGGIVSKLQLAFVYLVPDGDPASRATLSQSAMADLIVVPAKDYQQAAEVSRQLVEEGIQAIELCAGFGNVGVAKVAQAVAGKVPVGVVRFDSHPTLGFKSGDEMFDTK